MDLQGKTAVITGGGRGIGRALAEAFAAEGCKVAVTARTEQEIAAAAAAIEAAGGRALAVPCDVSDKASVAAMAAEVQERLGPPEILINNAGYASFQPFMELELEEWQRTLDVNLTGIFLCSRAFLPDMIQRESGCIINMSSVSGLRPIPKQSVYCASKHGVNGLTTTMAMELREHGIRVHAICPGGTKTRLVEENMPERDKTGWMEPEDIAHTALYLATMPSRATVDIVYLRRYGSKPLGG
jgi:3-oxoacyl-[acyl-carrier protein] reductase